MDFRGTKTLGVWKSVYFTPKVYFWKHFQHLLKTKYFLQNFLQHIILAIFHVFELDDALKLLILAKIYEFKPYKVFPIEIYSSCKFSEKKIFLSMQKFLRLFLGSKSSIFAILGRISCKYGPIKKIVLIILAKNLFGTSLRPLESLDKI